MKCQYGEHDAGHNNPTGLCSVCHRFPTNNMKFDDWKAEQKAKVEQNIKSPEEVAQWVEDVNTWLAEHEVEFVIGLAHHNTWGHLAPAIAGFEIYRDEFVLD